MRLAELDALTIDAYGTLVRLTGPVPELQAGLAALGVERDAEAVGLAFAKESAYYREHSFEGRDEASLYDLRLRCVAIILEELGLDLEPAAFDRWLAPVEPDPRDLLVPYPAEPMTIWPISLRVNSPVNDEAAILERAS